jgi:hypothetical protein
MKKLLLLIVLFFSCIHNAFLPGTFENLSKKEILTSSIVKLDTSKNYRIRNFNSALYLASNGFLDGNNVYTKFFAIDNLQVWRVYPVTPDYYFICNIGSVMVLDIDLSLINVCQYLYNSAPTQHWKVEFYNGHWKIINVDSGLCLSAENNGIVDETNVIQSAWAGANGQLWDLIENP